MDELTEELQKLHDMCLEFCKVYLMIRTICNYLANHPDDLKKVLEILKEGE